jgi:hypothetical protein
VIPPDVVKCPGEAGETPRVTVHVTAVSTWKCPLGFGVQEDAMMFPHAADGVTVPDVSA